MANVNTILSRLISSLTIADPSWDTSVGSATYKILESVANELAVVANNSTLQTYSYSAIGKSGTELDAFVNLWGITRQLGSRSVGSATFSIPAASSINISIPIGTQISVPAGSSSTGSNIYFSTTSSAIIPAGLTEIEVPITSTLTGSINNVGIGLINTLSTPIVGYPSVINYKSMIGGADTETDSQLQVRWLSTAFNNISGTNDQFVSVVSQNPNITALNIVSAQETANEILQITTAISGGTVSTTSGFQLGLQTWAQLAVTSGNSQATPRAGSFAPNMTITSGFITASTSGIVPATGGLNVYYDGTNFNLIDVSGQPVYPTVSGSLYLNYYTYNATVLSGSSTASGVANVLNSLINLPIGIPNTTVALISGNNSFGTTLSSGIVISGTQLSVAISGRQTIAGSGTNLVTITTSGTTTFSASGNGSYAGITISGQTVNYNWNNVVGTISGGSIWQIIMSGIPMLTGSGVGYSSLISSGTTAATLTISGANPGVFIVSGTSIPQVFTGININLNQNIGYNIVLSGASTNNGKYGAINSITSQLPDVKYVYPQGQEQIGINLGSANQVLFTENFDYNYPFSTNPPLIVTLNPTINNAPYSDTGGYLQMVSEYIPTSSRIINPTINSNIIDLFIGSTTSNNVTEQVFYNPNITFNGISGQPYYAGNFQFADGTSCLAGTNSVVPSGSATGGDWYIPFNANPVNNYPNQLISGNLPSYVTLGNYNVPIAVKYVQYSSNGGAPSTTGLYGTAGSNVLYTTQSISGLCTGIVAISGCNLTASGYVTFGTYITGLVPGTPNQIQLSTVLLSGIVSNSTVNATWATIAYPVYDITNNAGSILDATGIGIDAANFAGYQFPIQPPVSTVGVINHYYNSDVSQIDNTVQQSRVIGTNVLTRQAQYLRMIFCLSIVYQTSVNTATVNNNIQSAIIQYLGQLYFKSTVSFSSIVTSVLAVNGVASARITTPSDNPNNYGVQTVAIDGTLLNNYTHDITLANNQLPLLYGIRTVGLGSSNF